MNAVLIFVGGGLGSLARWLIQMWVSSPLATLIVNWVGSFAIGLLLKSLDGTPWLFLGVVGFLGGFTTFSGFSIDTIKLWQEQSWWLQYAVASVVGALFFCWVGTFVSHRFL